MKKLIGIVVIVSVLSCLGKQDFSSTMNFVFIIVCALAMVPVTLIGRRMLDFNPAKVVGITAAVQAARLLLFGTAIIKAIKTADAWTMGLVLPVPHAIGLAVLIVTGAALAFTMLNLALHGLGAPAFASSLKLATDWLYNKMRNPMVLAMFAWLLAWGLYLQSIMFALWVLILVVPVEILFEKLFEERELEIRFGESYLQYREKTPFMFPRLGLFDSLGKTMVAVAGKISLFVVVLGLFLTVTTGIAYSANWLEIPFSRGGAYIDLNVKENQEIMVFWFLSTKVKNPSEYQAKLTSGADAWKYEGKDFTTCLRKIEVNFSKNPREVRSAFALYFDSNGKQVGNTEATKSDWVAESGPRLWADLLRAFFAKQGNDAGEVPTIIAISK